MNLSIDLAIENKYSVIFLFFILFVSETLKNELIIHNEWIKDK